MYHIRNIIAFLATLSIWACTPSDNPGGGDKPSGKEPLPEPPETVTDAHVFIVDMFSTLEDEKFFVGRDVSVAAEYIRSQSPKLSLMYFFDRADFTVGQSHPMTDIAYSLGVNQLFAQCGPTSDGTIPGTGIITRYPLSDYDGIACDGAYMCGCKVPVPVTGTPQVYLSTARICSLSQAETIFALRKLHLISDTIIVGTVSNQIKDKVLEYFESMSLRTVCMESDQTEYDIFVVTPAEYVCRGFEAGKTVNLPYYRVSIEKWM